MWPAGFNGSTVVITISFSYTVLQLNVIAIYSLINRLYELNGLNLNFNNIKTSIN